MQMLLPRDHRRLWKSENLVQKTGKQQQLMQLTLCAAVNVCRTSSHQWQTVLMDECPLIALPRYFNTEILTQIQHRNSHSHWLRLLRPWGTAVLSGFKLPISLVFLSLLLLELHPCEVPFLRVLVAARRNWILCAVYSLLCWNCLISPRFPRQVRNTILIRQFLVELQACLNCSAYERLVRQQVQNFASDVRLRHRWYHKSSHQSLPGRHLLLIHSVLQQLLQRRQRIIAVHRRLPPSAQDWLPSTRLHILLTLTCGMQVVNTVTFLLSVGALESPSLWWAWYAAVWYSTEIACLHVCLSARIFQNPHVQTSQNFLYMLSVAAARSSSDNAIHYVLSVLKIQSLFTRL